MQLAISMYSYHAAVKDGRLDIPKFVYAAKEAGADGVELLDFFYKDSSRIAEDRAAARDALASTGLPVPIFSVANNFAKTEPGERDEQLRRITFGVDEALEYGAGVVRVFAGDVAEGITFDQARAWIVEGLAEASIYAHDHSIRLALENHGKLAGRGDQIRDLILDVRQRAGNDALGANPDTGNFLLVDQPSHEAIAQVAEFANMVHFKDFVAAPEGYEGWTFASLGGAKFLGACIGEGLVDLGRCVSTLKDAGFDGWLSLEYEGPEDPIVAVPRSLENARRFL